MNRESREHMGKTKSKQEKIEMSFVVRAVERRSAKCEVGWREARIPRFDLKTFKAEGNAD